MSKKLEVHGNIPAMVTPFKKNEEIDEEALRELVNYLINGKVHAIFASGTVGTFYLMNANERIHVGEIVVDEVNGRVPVYIGAGGITVRENIKVAKAAKDIGADAVVVLTPYYIKVSDEELYDYFKTIAASIDIPVIIYNNPPRAHINISPKILGRLLDEVSNIVAMKDSSGDLALFEDYIEVAKNRISLITGKDELIYASLLVGGKGMVNAVGNIIPEIVTELYEKVLAGKIKEALELQHKIFILKEAFLEGTYPAPIMAALNMIGLNGGYPRKPVLPIKKEAEEKLRKTLISIGKIRT